MALERLTRDDAFQGIMAAVRLHGFKTFSSDHEWMFSHAMASIMPLVEEHAEKYGMWTTFRVRPNLGYSGTVADAVYVLKLYGLMTIDSPGGTARLAMTEDDARSILERTRGSENYEKLGRAFIRGCEDYRRQTV